ncbi:MAG: phospho-N-acetylmuramoyl-pentapeptide-transferase [Clostridia bacterium]|jgi:phospho-N-acetylmuramoyl-pentapeptide-transferase|nr:phospho-N-acetylmuramoyl-pentapeptide-transferase [Clostridia bacterium]MDD4572114.1 phospho-N-acetylmuramoyl-pentapeptide-transferase [Clostridia bacterium]
MKTAMFALLTALLIGILSGPFIIILLRRLKFGQTIRAEGPKRHLQKAGTPTMGGIIFLAASTIAILIWGDGSRELMLVLFATLFYGLIGFVDDGIIIMLKRSLGLTAKQKLAFQFLLAFFFLYIACHVLGRGTHLIVPVLGMEWELGIFYYLFISLFMVFMVNAVNLTDGLDGLAGGISFLVLLTYLIICLLSINHPPVEGLNYNDLAVGAGALAGGILAFLFFNRYPAKVFMGDTGSLALGGAVMAFAILTKTEILFILIGGVYFLEALSVVIQVASFRLTGKRVFKMSPLHHHFEMCGWPETRVVALFWVFAAILAGLGLLLTLL